MTRVLLSGFAQTGFYQSVARLLKPVISDTKSLLFIASNPRQHQKLDEYTQRISGFFDDIGIRFERYEILDDRMPGRRQANAVAEASCVFLMGGETPTQIKYLRGQRLIEPLRQHRGVIIGMSAGAINMAVRSALASVGYRHPPSVHEGIGLTDISIIPHYNNMSEEFVRDEVLPLTYDGTVYGLCDDAIIIDRDNAMTYGGTIYKLQNGGIELFSRGEFTTE